MNVHEVVVLFAGGGNTQPLYVVIKLFSSQVVEILKPSLKLPSPFIPLTPRCVKSAKGVKTTKGAKGQREQRGSKGCKGSKGR